MAEIGVLLRGRETSIVFEAENWKFSDKFLRLVEGDHLVAQFPTGAVLCVWFEEPGDGTEDLATKIVFSSRGRFQPKVSDSAEPDAPIGSPERDRGAGTP